MRYFINQYEFDAVSLVLHKNGVSISIRHNEALLLKLLLENQSTVISKDDILSEVWQGKVVSDQAVFQNISNLRAIFGTESIKTYAKRGYQWQLPISAISKQALDKPVIEKTTSRFTPRFVLSLSLIFVISLIALTSLFFKSDATKQLAIVPFSQTGLKHTVKLADTLSISSHTISAITSREFFATQILSYQQLKDEFPIILTGNVHTSQNGVIIDFTLVGQEQEWQGQIFSKNVETAYQSLDSHLQQTFIVDWVNKATSPDVKLATLTLAHQQNSDDLIILNQLAKAYLTLNKLDTAMTLADKLEQLAVEHANPLQQGNALLLQSTVLTRKELEELSAHKLKLAIEHFKKIDDHPRLADAYNANSWLEHLANDYAGIKQSMLASINHAAKANDIARELHGLTYLSVLAHKHKNQSDKYHYLQLAESKMDEYQLPQYHYAKVPFHYAIYADNPADKEPHLKQVLIYTEHTPDHWVAQSSRRQLLDYYLETQRLTLANELVTPLTTHTPENSLLKARLALANQDLSTFERLGKLAFEQAQLAGKIELSLDIALLLCHDPKEQINHDFYLDYINQNATVFWTRRNQTQLHALNTL